MLIILSSTRRTFDLTGLDVATKELLGISRVILLAPEISLCR
jgi:hypothetical protein